MAEQIKILWADDEIDLLKPHLLFLENKGYQLVTVTNGHDALEEVERDTDIDVVFLDESMPGLTGLDTLEKLKADHPLLPVVMITKNEEEDLMDQAISSNIVDYLIKPVKPIQILGSLKKTVHFKEIKEEAARMGYLKDHRSLTSLLDSRPGFREWVEIYRKIIRWEIEFEAHPELEMVTDLLVQQKKEANTAFFKFISKEYLHWMEEEGEGPLMSPRLMREKVYPLMNQEEPVVMLLLDNLRFDQWKVIEPLITEDYRVEEEDFSYSILPTTTQYSRNAIFAGMSPLEIQQRFPKWWRHDFEEGGKNQFEEQLLQAQTDRTLRRDARLGYLKVTNSSQSAQLPELALNLLNNDLSVVVYNLLDILSHVRNESEVFKELSRDERAYRSLTQSWFEHSSLREMLRKMAERKFKLVIATDHGTIRVNTPSKVVGDRETTTNLRYKVGKNLKYREEDVFAIRRPEDARLPKPNVSSTYVFAKEDLYFLYPNNYNRYLNLYRDTFQHGGISMEEMICPVIRLSPK